MGTRLAMTIFVSISVYYIPNAYLCALCRFGNEGPGLLALAIGLLN